MSTTLNDVMNDIASLTPSEKGFVAQFLIASLDRDHDADSEEAWADVAQKRYDELRSGSVEAVSWDRIKTSILHKQ